MAIHVACALSILLSLTEPVAAQDCRLALVLAIDVSSSVNAAEHRLQREGLAGALTDPEVQDAFLVGDPVALHIFEWSEQAVQRPLLPGWRMIDRQEDLLQIAAHILQREPRPDDGTYARTAVGAALGYAAAALADAPPCRAQTVDIAGDGENNDGIMPREAHRLFVPEGVTVNALIVALRGEPGHPAAEQATTRRYARLSAAFRRDVLRGPNAFCVVADGYEDYQRAMIAKLLRELELPAISGRLAVADAG